MSGRDSFDPLRTSIAGETEIVNRAFGATKALSIRLF